MLQTAENATTKFVPGQSGNPRGRPKGSDYIRRFNQALKTVERKTGKSLLQHAIYRAFESDPVLIAIIRKIIPEIRNVEIATSGGPLAVTNNLVVSSEDVKHIRQVIAERIAGPDDDSQQAGGI